MIFCDVLTGTPRPLVPRIHRRHVFDAIHGLSHPSDSQASFVKVCLALTRQRRDSMDQILHSMPAIQNKQTHSGSITGFPSSRCAFSTYSCGSGRTSASIKRIYLSVHHHRQIHKMAGSYPAQRHFNSLTCPRFHIWLDFTLWNSDNSHKRQRTAVHLRLVESGQPASWNRNQLDYCLSSSEQRHR